MKKLLLLLMALTLVMCKSTQPVADAKTVKPAATAKTNIQYRDDFRAATSKEKAAFLKELKATEDEYSVLIFTKGYKGEGIQVSNAKKVLYSGYAISNLKTGIAHQLRIDNTVDTKVFDSFTKKSVVLEAAEAKKHKFIYVRKDSSNKSNPFFITYSNTLRPLE